MTTTRVDMTALRVNQICIAALLALSFVTGQVAGVLLVALVMVVGTAIPTAGLFQVFYRRVLRPLGIVHPDVRADSPAPHRFAQGMGAGVLVLALLTLGGHAALGWALVLLVIALAVTNLTTGFCAGCFVYYQMERAHLLPSRAV